jgi:hypothetical protein
LACRYKAALLGNAHEHLDFLEFVHCSEIVNRVFVRHMFIRIFWANTLRP